MKTCGCLKTIMINACVSKTINWQASLQESVKDQSE